MNINKTYSKLELIKILDDLQIIHTIDKSNTKEEVVEYIKMNYRKFKILNKDNKYNIDNIPKFKKYLSADNPYKKLSIKEKNKVMLNAKRVINYCLDFNIEQSTFKSVDEVVETLEKIKNYNYISSVRRALNLFNNNNLNYPKINYNIIDEVKYDLKKLDEPCEIKIRRGIFRYDMLNCKLTVIEEW